MMKLRAPWDLNWWKGPPVRKGEREGGEELSPIRIGI